MGGRIPAILPVALAAALFSPINTLAFQLPLAGLHCPHLAARRPPLILQRRSMGLVVTKPRFTHAVETTVCTAADSARNAVVLKPADGGITTTVSAAADSTGNEVGLEPAGGGKPITFKHRLCVAPMIGVWP